MTSSLKKVGTEEALPVQPASGAAPEDDSESSYTSGCPATGEEAKYQAPKSWTVRARMNEAAVFAQDKALVAKSRTVVAVAAAQDTANSYLNSMKARVACAVLYTRDLAKSTAEGAQMRASAAATAALNTKSSTVTYVVTLRDAGIARLLFAADTARSAVADVQRRAGTIFGDVGAATNQYVDMVRTRAWAMSSGIQAEATVVVERIQKARAAAVAAALSRIGQSREMIASTRTKAIELSGLTKTKAIELTDLTRTKTLEMADRTKTKAIEVADITKTKAIEVSVAARSAAKEPKVQVTAASAAGGAVAMGTAGGATGLAAGGTIGAVIGVVPALFTFGLSIPIGAVIGGGTGLVVGTAIGGTVGAVGAGSVGYGAYSHKDEISSAASKTKAKAGDCADYVRGKAQASAGYVTEKASAAKSRVLGVVSSR